jgi:tRNA (adenine22-N1)-methyltransferase
MDTPAGKQNIRIARRLETALAMLPPCVALVDVGCDHGKLGLAALTAGRARRVLAVDISEASLAKAKALFSRYGRTAEFLCADGLSSLRLDGDEPYSIAILGMGGELIADILGKDEAVAKRAEAIVLQPMGGERELRGWLCQNGYAVADENAVFDAGRYYQLIAAYYRPGEAAAYADEALLEFGAVCYQKRQDALRGLLERVRASREKRMERAKKNGKIPETLARELNGVIRLLEGWEEKI